MRWREDIDDEKRDRQADQRQPGNVHRQRRRHEQQQDHRDGADHAWQDRTGAAQFADDAVHGDEEEQEHHLGPPDQLKHALARGHRDLHDFRVGSLECPAAGGAPVELLQQVRDVVRDEIDDIRLEGLLGRGRDAL